MCWFSSASAGGEGSKASEAGMDGTAGGGGILLLLLLALVRFTKKEWRPGKEGPVAALGFLDMMPVAWCGVFGGWAQRVTLR